MTCQLTEMTKFRNTRMHGYTVLRYTLLTALI